MLGPDSGRLETAKKVKDGKDLESKRKRQVAVAVAWDGKRLKLR